MQKPEKVHLSEVHRWLHEPVTQILLYNLDHLRGEIIRNAGDGGCIPSPNSTYTLEQLYHQAQGGIDTVDIILNGDGIQDFIEMTDLVTESEGEANE